MTGHFFSQTTRKEIIRDALKVLEIIQATFKRMPDLFTDDNVITALFSLHIQPH